MATRRTTAQRTLQYTVAGDPRARGFLTFEAALSLATTIASERPDDGEEYRHGVLLNGTVVGSAVRHTDGSITARHYSKEK